MDKNENIIKTITILTTDGNNFQAFPYGIQNATNEKGFALLPQDKEMNQGLPVPTVKYQNSKYQIYLYTHGLPKIPMPSILQELKKKKGFVQQSSLLQFNSTLFY